MAAAGEAGFVNGFLLLGYGRLRERSIAVTTSRTSCPSLNDELESVKLWQRSDMGQMMAVSEEGLRMRINMRNEQASGGGTTIIRPSRAKALTSLIRPLRAS